MQLHRPLDFIAVTDHAEYPGVLAVTADGSHSFSGTPVAQDLNVEDSGRMMRAITYMKNSEFNDVPMTAFPGDGNSSEAAVK